MARSSAARVASPGPAAPAAAAATRPARPRRIARYPAPRPATLGDPFLALRTRSRPVDSSTSETLRDRTARKPGDRGGSRSGSWLRPGWLQRLPFSWSTSRPIRYSRVRTREFTVVGADRMAHIVEKRTGGRANRIPHAPNQVCSLLTSELVIYRTQELRYFLDNSLPRPTS